MADNIFTSDDSSIYLNIPYCEFYIPMFYFDGTTKKFADDEGSIINVLGIFSVGIFKNGAGSKMTELRTMNLPTQITINVYDSEVREVELENGQLTQCKVIKYLKGSKVMPSFIIKDDAYAKKFLQYLTKGDLPKTLPYSKLLSIWIKNQQLTSVNYGVGSYMLELVLAAMYRNPNKLSEKFAKIASNEGVSDYDYATASIRQICQYNSTFSALTFEDMDSMITSSLNRSREKVKEGISPVEQIIKF